MEVDARATKTKSASCTEAKKRQIELLNLIKAVIDIYSYRSILHKWFMFAIKIGLLKNGFKCTLFSVVLSIVILYKMS